MLPFGRFGGGKFLDLIGEPAGGIGPRLGIIVKAQNERPDFFIAAAAVDLDQVLDGAGKLIFPGVVRMKLFVQRFGGKLAGFAFVENRELRVEAKLVKMLAHEPQAKTVQRADVREVKARDLFRPKRFVRRRRAFFLQTLAQSLAQLSGGGFGESNHQQFLKRGAIAIEAIEAAGDERLGFAGSGTGHDEHVAARGDRLPLGRRERIKVCGRGFHCA